MVYIYIYIINLARLAQFFVFEKNTAQTPRYNWGEIFGAPELQLKITVTSWILEGARPAFYEMMWIGVFNGFLIVFFWLGGFHYFGSLGEFEGCYW